jgi:hypothetical protein
MRDPTSSERTCSNASASPCTSSWGSPRVRPQEQFDEAMVADDLKGDLFKV